jgi:hypothetical protein
VVVIAGPDAQPSGFGDDMLEPLPASAHRL